MNHYTFTVSSATMSNKNLSELHLFHDSFGLNGLK